MEQTSNHRSRAVNIPIGQNVRAERVRRGEKQGSVAQILRVSQAAYSERERGEVPFSAPELFTLAQAFGIDVSTFFPSEVPVLAAQGPSRAAA